MSFASFAFTVAAPPPVPVPVPPPDGYVWSQLTDGTLPDGLPIGELDCVNTARERLYKQWERQPTWIDMCEAHGTPFRELDVQQGEILEQTTIQGATASRLDAFGASINLPRNGMTDDEYRAAIKIELQTLYASGTILDVLASIGSILNDPARSVTYVERYPASFLVSIADLTLDEYELILALVCDVPAAGVAALLGASDLGLSGGFGYDAGPPDYAGSWSYGASSNTPGICAPWGYSVPFSLRC